MNLVEKSGVLVVNVVARGSSKQIRQCSTAPNIIFSIDAYYQRKKSFKNEKIAIFLDMQNGFHFIEKTKNMVQLEENKEITNFFLIKLPLN